MRLPLNKDQLQALKERMHALIFSHTSLGAKRIGAQFSGYSLAVEKKAGYLYLRLRLSRQTMWGAGTLDHAELVDRWWSMFGNSLTRVHQ